MLTHFNEQSRARMVDVTDKDVTHRVAVAAATVKVNAHTMSLIKENGIEKGDVLAVAQVAGIMAAKRTPELIPMCHPLPITAADIRFSLTEEEVHITATIRCSGVTGVEMEALTAAATAALTIYDMCKAVQRDIEITDIRLMSKSGGKSGDYQREQHG